MACSLLPSTLDLKGKIIQSYQESPSIVVFFQPWKNLKQTHWLTTFYATGMEKGDKVKDFPGRGRDLLAGMVFPYPNE